jgi:hypothetical protein
MVTRPGQATERGRRRSHFLVTIVAMFLVIEMAIRQASNLMLVSHSDYFSAHHSRHHNSCSPRVSMPSKRMSADDDDMMRLVSCEEEDTMERLLLLSKKGRRTTLSQLRNQRRSHAVWPARLASLLRPEPFQNRNSLLAGSHNSFLKDSSNSLLVLTILSSKIAAILCWFLQLFPQR